MMWDVPVRPPVLPTPPNMQNHAENAVESLYRPEGSGRSMPFQSLLLETTSAPDATTIHPVQSPSGIFLDALTRDSSSMLLRSISYLAMWHGGIWQHKGNRNTLWYGVDDRLVTS